MGFFSNLWNGIKNIGKKIFGGIANVGKKVLSIPNTIKGGLTKAYDFVKKIPVIGDIAQTVANAPIIRGYSPAQIAGMASQGLDLANKGVAASEDLSKGNFKDAFNKAKDVYTGVANFQKPVRLGKP